MSRLDLLTISRDTAHCPSCCKVSRVLQLRACHCTDLGLGVKLQKPFPLYRYKSCLQSAAAKTTTKAKEIRVVKHISRTFPNLHQIQLSCAFLDLAWTRASTHRYTESRALAPTLEAMISLDFLKFRNNRNNYSTC